MITFYERAVGYSHLASNTPCQDNGCHFSEDGVHVAIICDGHGSDTYVRSQDGSQLAAEIALEKVRAFIGDISPDFFAEKKGAVTSQPIENPLKDSQGNSVEYSSLSEIQQELMRQNQSYIEECSKYPEIEKRFRNLFKEIVDAWNIAIEEDRSNRPFSAEENEKLGEKRIQKAYGTTLMVAVRTPSYWFAFHIGDGKLLVCDKLMQWTEPIPWDCRCFLNRTTSLCDSSPITEFRYAFDGTGNFPIAFALGSDGIDDTFCQPELLHQFYSQLLVTFHTQPKEKAQEFLKESLPVLSERGSHDDMSVAAIIDESELEVPLQRYAIISEVRSINKERTMKEKKIKSIKKEYAEQVYKIYEQSCREAWADFCQQHDIDEAEERVLDAFHNYIRTDENLSLLKKKWEKKLVKETTRELLNKEKKEFNEWVTQKRNLNSEYKKKVEALESLILSEAQKESEVKECPDNPTEEAQEIRDVDVRKSQPITPEESERLDRESEEQTKEILK